ncbi:hypothetical protein BCR44DRAFT_46016, partial [Catenaria anguillulae PL171]
MDNYRQASTASSSVSVRPAASAGSSTAQPSQPAIPIVTVKENGKIRAYVQATIKHLQPSSSASSPADSPRSVIVRGDGQAINKTVSVVEIVKRQFVDSAIEQANELGCTKETITYEPTVPRLDKLQTSRSIPYLAVTLTASSSSPALTASG